MIGLDRIPRGGFSLIHKTALGFLGLASPAILASFLLSGPFAEASFALLAVAVPVALIAVGASRGGSLGPLRWPLAALLLLLEGCVVGMLLLRGRIFDAPWAAGLPLAAAIQLYGMWLAPLGLVALAYALTFESFGLRREDLERLRRRFGGRGGE